VDGASLTVTDLLFDDCHFTPSGEEAFANLLGLEIDPLVHRATPATALGRVPHEVSPLVTSGPVALPEARA
jgi:hypothetical protein